MSGQGLSVSNVRTGNASFRRIENNNGVALANAIDPELVQGTCDLFHALRPN